MKSKELHNEPLTKLLLSSMAAGICMFWLVGIWFLPEKNIILKYFRGYISIGFLTSLIGAFAYEKPGKTIKKAGKLILSIGFFCVGSFFALCFYLAITSNSK